MGPPPTSNAEAGAGRNDDGTTASPDISNFLQQLAERYASLTSATDNSTALSAVA